MKNLSIDIETFSSVNLAKSGVYRYAESPDFEILLFGYSVDGGPAQVVDFTQGEELPAEVLTALIDTAVKKWAFNCSFERTCIARYLRDRGMLGVGEFLSPTSWYCSMVWSAYMGLPLSLKGVGAVLGLEQQKMDEGKDLIRYFCCPCKPTQANGGRERNLPKDAPDKWDTFKRYNKRDVEVEMAIQQKLGKFPVPQQVWEEYRQDQEINDQGILVDRQLVQNAIAISKKCTEENLARAQAITGLENPNSPIQLKEWLTAQGVTVESLVKKEVQQMLDVTSGNVHELLVLRQQLSKSSVKKYTAMVNVAGSDDRARGLFQFYGANRSGRFAGRLVQLQNLARNSMPDLAQARQLVRQGNYAALGVLYDSVPDVLSQLIRTAFIPKPGRKFIVADFSAIECRVLAWLAGEQWVLDVFAAQGDIYCATAEKMFHVPVVKHGQNGELRQKGKQATLSCIAEGQMVLTDQGLIPIEKVTLEHRVWDGESWVKHDGIIYKGEQEVIEYEGLVATQNHLVWVEGKTRPIRFGEAAASGAHLIQTGDGGRTLRLGENNQFGETMERSMESLLCPDKMHRMRQCSMAEFAQSQIGQIEGMSEMLSAKANTVVAGQEAGGSKRPLREFARCSVPMLRGARDSIRVQECNRGGALSDWNLWCSSKKNGNRPDRHKRQLRSWESAICDKSAECQQSAEHSNYQIRPTILAILPKCRDSQIVSGRESNGDYPRCKEGCAKDAQALGTHRGTARVYDIRNAGRYHRFTVSGKLVHNCGYGGSVGALKAMGAIESGMKEDELQPLVDAWREANPNIVKFWWDVDHAAKAAVKGHTTTETHGLQFVCRSGMLFIELPSGRHLAYVLPRIGENRFGGESITYMGIGATKKWERIETFAGKLVENITQAVARDVLCYAMQTLRDTRIVMHVHDELIIEADERLTLQEVCEKMGQTPPWASGLLLRADGYECQYYQKD